MRSRDRGEDVDAANTWRGKRSKQHLLEMEVAMSIDSLSQPPLSNSLKTHEDYGFLRALVFVSCSRGAIGVREGKKKEKRSAMVVEAKGEKGMSFRQFQMPPPPPLLKIKDDDNPKFVIVIKTANVSNSRKFPFYCLRE